MNDVDKNLKMIYTVYVVCYSHPYQQLQDHETPIQFPMDQSSQQSSRLLEATGSISDSESGIRIKDEEELVLKDDEIQEAVDCV